ncbi:MAG: SDR family NAD(P)-dependent oxidoreductase [Candidatus Cryptobacteroides sp.]
MEFAVITGAASGMGKIYAKSLAQRGFGLCLIDINEKGLAELDEELHSLLGEHCPEIRKLAQNLADPDAACIVVGQVKDLNIKILINNAGMIFTSSIEETSYAKLRSMMMLHMQTPLLLCHELLPQLRACGGHILNISSICAWMHWPAIGMYGNTKAFVKNYSRSLRIELRGSGVSVTTAYFGAVDTPLFGFSPKVRRIMRRLGIMISPQKAVSKALRAMFKRRRSITPGFLNKLATLFAPLLSERFLAFLYRKFKHLL